MLVLSRKPGEKILIGPDVEVVVVRIGPNTVRLGITAPNGVTIIREELLGPIDETPVPTAA
jgi:carbon storage regulator